MSSSKSPLDQALQACVNTLNNQLLADQKRFLTDLLKIEMVKKLESSTSIHSHVAHKLVNGSNSGKFKCMVAKELQRSVVDQTKNLVVEQHVLDHTEDNVVGRLQDALPAILMEDLAEHMNEDVTERVTQGVKDRLKEDYYWKEDLAESMMEDVTQCVTREVKAWLKKYYLKKDLVADLSEMIGCNLAQKVEQRVLENYEWKRRLLVDLQGAIGLDVKAGLIEDDHWRGGLRTDLFWDIKGEMKGALGDEIREEIGAEIKEQIKEEVKEEVKWELKAEIQEELRRDLRAQLCHDMRRVTVNAVREAERNVVPRARDTPQAAAVAVTTRPARNLHWQAPITQVQQIGFKQEGPAPTTPDQGINPEPATANSEPFSRAGPSRGAEASSRIKREFKTKREIPLGVKSETRPRTEAIPTTAATSTLRVVTRKRKARSMGEPVEGEGIQTRAMKRGKSIGEDVKLASIPLH